MQGLGHLVIITSSSSHFFNRTNFEQYLFKLLKKENKGFNSKRLKMYKALYERNALF